jgi:copper oxidase (laccase) domain-containing protein
VREKASSRRARASATCSAEALGISDAFKFTLVAALNGNSAAGSVSIQSVTFSDHYLSPIPGSGGRVGIVAGAHPAHLHFPATDALVTAIPGQFLGVWVADCGTVFIADAVKRVCGIAHSGKKGTELGIAAVTIQRMQEVHGSNPADLVVQLAPCIRPPAYEIDFATRIVSDCIAAGVPAAQVHDCGVCTSSDPARYYSYRLEKGRTGRMFGFIGWA